MDWIARNALWWYRTRNVTEEYTNELHRLHGWRGNNALQSLLVDELVQRRVDNAEVLTTFRMKWERMCEDKALLSLVPEPSRWEQYGVYVEETRMTLEDYSEDVVFGYEPLLAQLGRLQQQMTASAMTSEQCAPVANFVLDLVLTCALVPSALVFVPGKHDVELHFDYQGGVMRNWIHSLPIDLVVETVKDLRFFVTDMKHVKNSVLMSHLDWEKYQTQSIPQRIAQLSLFNLAGYPLRDAICKDNLVRRVVESPQLLQWMLCCSNMDEQYWLNTCEVAARNNVLAARLCTVAHCLVVTRLTLERIRAALPSVADNKPWTSSLWSSCCRVPSQRQHTKHVLARVEVELDELTARAHALLDGKECDIHGLHALVLDWNRTAQYLSSVFFPDEPVVLTRKLFSENWQLSAKTISLPCILVSLLPRQPWVMARNDGSPGEHDAVKSWFLWRAELSPTQYPELKDLHKKMATMSEAEATDTLNRLWSLALQCGGIFFASKEHIWGVEVGHLNVLYALRMPNSGKHFLVCDPEIRHYKWLLFRDMKELIINPRVNFDLFDV